jgi:hypothetical protein
VQKNVSSLPSLLHRRPTDRKDKGFGASEALDQTSEGRVAFILFFKLFARIQNDTRWEPDSGEIERRSINIAKGLRQWWWRNFLPELRRYVRWALLRFLRLRHPGIGR